MDSRSLRTDTKKSTKAEGPTAPDRETLIAEEWNKMTWEVTFYVLQRNGGVDPNNDQWRVLVGRAKASFEAVARAAGLVPDHLLRDREGAKG
jgi:hypothetical protein